VNQQLAMRFHHDLVEGIQVLKREIGYAAPRFSQMLNDPSIGGVEATRRLLRGPKTSEGFQILYFKKRLGRSVEAWMLRPEFEELFTDAEREIARRRLESHEFNVDRYLHEPTYQM
jgi:hypothetical protein